MVMPSRSFSPIAAAISRPTMATTAAQGDHHMAYEPAPVDTSGVTLSDSLHDLTELLAKNAHDLWAQQRLAEGWTYGPTREDTRKEHPCLVPYEALPEAEKAYDRQGAMETVKTLLALGYRIQPPSHG